MNECPELAYAQYNYTPPTHFAVREGHVELVEYLLSLGAHDSDYRFYPFQVSLQTVAADRGYTETVRLLDDYARPIRAAGDLTEITARPSIIGPDFSLNFNRP